MQKILNAYESKLFLMRKSIPGPRLKTLSFKQLLQRLPKAHTQIKPGDTSENLVTAGLELETFGFRV